MKFQSVLTVVLAIVSTGCASSRDVALPVCDGKHLRPVNLHGSVLQPLATATATATAASSAAGHRGCGR